VLEAPAVGAERRADAGGQDDVVAIDLHGMSLFRMSVGIGIIEIPGEDIGGRDPTPGGTSSSGVSSSRPPIVERAVL
ncbi:MAG: hypothetical protein ACREX3_17120, partial [Gammaproteobacteria bacterium]